MASVGAVDEAALGPGAAGVPVVGLIGAAAVRDTEGLARGACAVAVLVGGFAGIPLGAEGALLRARMEVGFALGVTASTALGRRGGSIETGCETGPDGGAGVCATR